MTDTLRLLLAGGLLAVGATAAFAQAAEVLKPAPKAMRIYVGTYTGPKSQGIYQVRLDMATGKLDGLEVAGEVTNPSFLALHPTKPLLYCVSETAGTGGKKAGALSAFSIDPATGKLTLLNSQPSGGAGPCYVSVDPEGKAALAANYGSGSVGLLPIGPDGRLAEPSCTIQHAGSGPNPKRQQGPHAHCGDFDPTGRFALVADLGLDKVFVYKFDAAKGTLVANDPPAAVVAPGAGPRHVAFHPNGRVLYVINEMGNTVTAFQWDSKSGAAKEFQTVPTLPADFTGQNTTAEVMVHPSGKFLYGSNRGHDSIAIFAIAEDGTLKAAGHQPSGGKQPRYFGIDPTGTYLLAGHQSSDNIVVFKIDPATGGLKPTGSEVTVGAPVCLKFVPLAK